jgi:ribose transport system permease protein
LKGRGGGVDVKAPWTQTSNEAAGIADPSAPILLAGADAGGGAALGPTHRVLNSANLRRYGVLLFLVLMFAAFSAIDPQHFLTRTNLTSIIQSNSTIVLLALVVTFQVRAGTIDFSVSASMVLGASIVAVLTTEDHLAVLPAALVAVAATTAVGAVNGILVVLVGLDGFIATLGMSTVLTGIAYAVTNESVITGLPPSLLHLGQDSIWDIPSAAFVGWGLAVVLWLIFEFTPLGRILAFVGGNQVSAKLAGVRVPAVRIGVFVAGAGLAGLAGVFLASTLGNVDPTSASSYLLTPLSVAFLGAAAIQVGRFNVAGTVIAVYLLAVAETGIELLGVALWVTEVFSGGALIFAIAFARITAIRQERLVALERRRQRDDTGEVTPEVGQGGLI